MKSYTDREVWLAVLVWFVLGVTVGAWAAAGFPMGVLL